jgi:lysophospholipase L1-like esterase
MEPPLYLADQGLPGFEQARTQVDVVCVGDSLTGWNNYGPAADWPWPTYPDFLAALCAAQGLRLANAGIAGEVSANGPQQVQQCLALFPHARWFIFGMGTNDLIAWPDTAATTSQRILENLGQMVAATLQQARQPILFNVPPVKESLLRPRRAAKVRAVRAEHNRRLLAFCTQRGLPLVDICTLLADEHFADTLHPNAAGAQLIAAAIHRSLVENGA